MAALLISAAAFSLSSLLLLFLLLLPDAQERDVSLFLSSCCKSISHKVFGFVFVLHWFQEVDDDVFYDSRSSISLHRFLLCSELEDEVSPLILKLLLFFSFLFLGWVVVFLNGQEENPGFCS
jgi:hypothetical protein